MLTYIIKSGACLGIFFIFYALFLEKENMHVFKRFYLLAALVLSLTIPKLIFTEYIEVQAPIRTFTEPAFEVNTFVQTAVVTEEPVLDTTHFLWSIYAIGVFFFGFRFLKNLLQINTRIRKNPKHKIAQCTRVLLQEKITPHTFFSFIFLTKPPCTEVQGFVTKD